MATMKYPNMPGGPNMASVTAAGNGTSHHVQDDVDSLFWQTSNINLQSDFIDVHSLSLDGNLGADKLLLDSPPIHHQDDNDIDTDALDFLSSQPSNTSLAELKPLPPFNEYSGNLSINGIQGHHYNTISQRVPEENNNNYNGYGGNNEQNIVSSSTCNNNVSADSAGDSTIKSMYSVDEVVRLTYVNCGQQQSQQQQQSQDSVTQIKTEIVDYDLNNLDFANMISSAIADTTVPNSSNQQQHDQQQGSIGDDPTGSRDSWFDLESFMSGPCVDQQKNLVITPDGLQEYVIPCSNSEFVLQQQQPKQESYQPIKIQPQSQQQQPQQQQQHSTGGSTLQTLLTHGYIPQLQHRLQQPIKQEVPSSTNYGNDLITTSSPPANVVSTTDNLMITTVNGRFISQYGGHPSMGDDHRIHSPDLMGQNYPHTTTTSTTGTPKKSRSRSQKKQQQLLHQQQQQQASSTVFQAEPNLGVLGREKPIHRCTMCNRGFLNKSNIKVHMRTHTGEKPFRCETCSKAFRQKAHLLKHQQIHRRIGRD